MSPVDEVMTALYAAIESDDDGAVRALMRSDVFVMTAAADGILLSADAVIADIKRWRQGCKFEITASVTGTSPSGDARWVFDQLVVGDVPVRVTALIARDNAWRIAAVYWSIPYGTQEEQNEVHESGKLAPGIELAAAVSTEAGPLESDLRAAMSRPADIPDLYSTDESHVTLGSVTHEVFVGAAGRAAWAEFVKYVGAFTFRGPLCGALVTPDAGWLAANIDVGAHRTPYRFFYIWSRDERGWKIVVSHDGVSRDPLSLTS